jgi:hypothetical protein
LVAHHQETIDAYMNDNNWLKIIRIGRSLGPCDIMFH